MIEAWCSKSHKKGALFWRARLFCDFQLSFLLLEADERALLTQKEQMVVTMVLNVVFMAVWC
jgi:hypothetical protein